MGGDLESQGYVLKDRKIELEMMKSAKKLG